MTEQLDTSAAAIAALLERVDEWWDYDHGNIFKDVANLLPALSAELTALRAERDILTAEKGAHKMRGDNHWETLRSIHVLAQEGKLDHIIQHVRDARAGYTKPDAITMWELQDGLAKAIGERDAALARVEDLVNSRNHFKYAAQSQRTKAKRLRHRQRALLSALETIKSAETLDDAKNKANIAIDGWNDDSLIFVARAALAPFGKATE